METYKRRLAGALLGIVSAVGCVIGMSGAAAAVGTCGYYGEDYATSYARSHIDSDDLCGRQQTAAKYYITGSSYTYTAYGSLGVVWGNEWIATSPAVPSGKSVAGDKTYVAYNGNYTTWYDTH